MMSPEQFQQLLQLFQQGAQGAAAGEGPPGFAQPYRGSKLVSKHFRSDTFNGEQVKWDEWSFIFKRGIRSMSKEVFQKMQETELSPDNIDEQVDLTEEMEQRSAELYDILCQYCIGDALRLVRSVDDMRGIEAWQKLFNKYNPRTMARGLRLLTQR